MTASLIRDARALIENPDDWCQNQFKVGAKRCATQALMDAWKMNGAPDVGPLLDAEDCVCQLITDDPYERLPKFNDSHTHAEVLGLFDMAIAMAEKRVEAKELVTA